jgi:hypothetical protein
MGSMTSDAIIHPEVIGTYTKSHDGFWVNQFGYAGTIPITGILTVMGYATLDAIIPEWLMVYVSKSSGFWATQFGYDGTIPIPDDYDGDGISDIACYSPED